MHVRDPFIKRFNLMHNYAFFFGFSRSVSRMFGKIIHPYFFKRPSTRAKGISKNWLHQSTLLPEPHIHKVKTFFWQKKRRT